ncbi:MAG: hypothetical protein FOCCV1_gp3 [Fushun oxya chinensis chuvirus 1]|nr:MAG: hypothetical protein FOCCV1_gp3 [Fushun oxya chinensis chuvirus 1]
MSGKSNQPPVPPTNMEENQQETGNVEGMELDEAANAPLPQNQEHDDDGGSSSSIHTDNEEEETSTSPRSVVEAGDLNLPSTSNARARSPKKRARTVSDEAEDGGSKRQRLQSSFPLLPEPEYPGPEARRPESFRGTVFLGNLGPVKKGRGYLDNKEVMNLIGKPDPLTLGFLCHEIFERHSGCDNTFHSMTDKATMALLISIAYCMSVSKRSEGDLILRYSGETMAPFLPPTLRHSKSMEMIIALTRGIISNANFGSAYFTIPTTIKVGAEQIVCPTDLAIAEEKIQDDSTAFHVLHQLISCATTRTNSFIARTYIHTIAAIVLRGNMTDDKANKLSDALTENGVLNSSLDSTTIRKIYACYGQYVDDTNAGPLLCAWKRDIPLSMIAVKVLINQAAFSGLTQLITIGRAIRQFPKFPWAKIGEAFGGELVAFLKALEEVKGNPFYGFKKNLGCVAASHYRKLAYVAKELLVRSGGNDTLKKYPGWIGSVPYKDQVLELIDKHVAENVVAGGMVEIERPENFEDLLSLNALLFQNSMFDIIPSEAPSS